MNWYAIATADDLAAVLLASGGFMGKPLDGAVQIGYSVLPAYQRRGFATEMVDALSQWALEQPGVERIAAVVHRDNEPSQRVLLNADFAFVGDAAEPDHLRFERWRGPVLMAKPFYLSNIPVKAVARPQKLYASTYDYYLDGKHVGRRFFDDAGLLERETAYRATLPYGRRFEWINGKINSTEAYDAQGRPHGTAYQWAADSRLMGSYTMSHGTGVDIWWQIRQDGTKEITEIRQYRDNLRHGYEWWLTGGEVPFSEEHWYAGIKHGIERQWNDQGRLRRSYPRYWINNERVRKDKYVRAAAKDDTLPPFRAEENLPQTSVSPRSRGTPKATRPWMKFI